MSLVPRAHRYGLRIPVVYRIAGENGWHRGRTENMSRSGLLFEGEDEGTIAPRTRVEIGLVLMDGAEAPQVFCDAEVVRRGPGSAERFPTELAARIRDYRFSGEMAPGGPFGDGGGLEA